MRKLLAAAIAFALVVAPSLRAGAEQRVALTLSEAIALAEKQNPDVRAAAAQTVAAYSQVRAAQGDRAPSLALSDSFLVVDPVAKLQTPLGPLPFSPNLTNLPVLSLHYSLYDGGAGAAQVGRAAADLVSAQASEHEARGALVDRVTASYVQYGSALDASKMFDNAEAVAKSDVDLTGKRFAAGMVPRADVLAARARYAERRAAAIEGRGVADVARGRLAAAIGIPLGTPIELAVVPDPTSERIDLQAAIDSAMTSRGELRTAKAAIDAASAALDEAKSAQRPSAQAFVSEGNVAPVVQSGFIPQFSVGLQAVWKLFDGGATAARIASASAGVDRARAAYDAARTQAELDVREAYVAFQTAREKAGAASDAVGAARESERLARLRYREGVGTQFELDAAALAYERSQLVLIQAKSEERTELARLRFVTGVL